MLGGCPGDDDGNPDIDTGPDMDAAVDAPEPTECDPLPEAFEPGAGTPHADPLGSAAGEARVGLLTEDMIPAPEADDLHTWEPGDFVLANDRVAVVIDANRPSDGYDPWGGKPNGVARVEGGALVEPAAFNELLIGVGRYTFEPSSVAVHDDGSGDAIVRAVGTLHPIPFVDDLARAFAPQDYPGFGFMVDYRLSPDSDFVDVTYHVRNEEVSGTSAPPMFLIFQTKRMPAFGPEVGFDVAAGDYAWMGFADEDATSYIVEPPEEVSLVLEISGAIVLQGSRYRIAECANTEQPYYRLHIGGRGHNGAMQALWRSNDVATQTLSGVVRDADGNPMPGVRVHAETADAYLTRTLTDETGNYSLDVPADVTPELRAFRYGEHFSDPVSSGDITMPAIGFIEVNALDASDNPMPVRVQVKPSGAAAPRAGARYGEPTHSQRTHAVYPLDGHTVLPVLPGMQQVVVSRGYEYEMFDSDVMVNAGETVSLDVVLDRVVDTTGVMCADYHIHTDRSPDSEDPALFKLASAIGDGLEIPCRSDHEWVYEWDDLAVAQGMGDFVFGVTSLELTTFAWGHFGVVPVDPRPMVNGGAVPWVDRTPEMVFEEVNSLPDDPVLIINHPRGAVISSYFTAVDYDPVTGEIGNPDLWNENFGAIEVFNDDSYDEAGAVIDDWYSFLNQGRRVWAVGSSDSHSVMGGSPVGYPRTCLEVGVDTPAELRAGGGAALVRDTTRAGAFTVSGGLYLTVEGRDGVGPGGEITGAMATETFRVTVQAASWIGAEEVEVIVDGDVVQTLPITPGTDVIRFQEDVEVTGGSWVVFHARGAGTLAPVHPGRTPFAVSQPIFMVR